MNKLQNIKTQEDLDSYMDESSDSYYEALEYYKDHKKNINTNKEKNKGNTHLLELIHTYIKDNHIKISNKNIYTPSHIDNTYSDVEAIQALDTHLYISHNS